MKKQILELLLIISLVSLPAIEATNSSFLNEEKIIKNSITTAIDFSAPIPSPTPSSEKILGTSTSFGNLDNMFLFPLATATPTPNVFQIINLPTATPTPIINPTANPTPTSEPTVTSAPSPAPTNNPIPTSTPILTQPAEQTPTPVDIQPTITPTVIPTIELTPTIAPTDTPVPTDNPSPTPPENTNQNIPSDSEPTPTTALN